MYLKRNYTNISHNSCRTLCEKPLFVQPHSPIQTDNLTRIYHYTDYSHLNTQLHPLFSRPRDTTAFSFKLEKLKNSNAIYKVRSK